MTDQKERPNRTKPWTTTQILILLSCVAIVVCFLLAAAVTVHWVGSRDLTIEFVVLDANPHLPIPGARLSFQDEGGFYEGGHDGGVKHYDLIADEHGRVFRVCPNSMCFGTSGSFKDTFAIHLPDWTIIASKDGYTNSEPLYVDVLENQKNVARLKHTATAYVQITIKLTKQPPK